MFEELILVLTQFGGGPGDPANNAVRFLLAAFFWFVLYLVSYRLWRDSRDRRHLLFLIAAVVGGSRELFMFVAEYGSHRGYFPFEAVFPYYPPLEHAVAILAIILMGYAFLRTYFNFAAFARIFLIGCSGLVSVTYAIIAPLWIAFLNTKNTADPAGGSYLGARFHDFPGDLIFRLEGALVTLLILGAFVYARKRAIKIPWLAFVAFFCFFADDAMQAWSNLAGNIYDPYFGPIRHNLHMAAIVMLVGVYWWEVTRQLERQDTFLKTLLDAIPDLISYKNRDDILLGCNHPYARTLLGQEKQQVIGRKEADLLADPALRAAVDKIDAQVIASNSFATYEQTRRFADGRLALLETIKTPIHDTEGRIIGIIDIARDISERRQLEEQLIHSQKLDAIGQLAGGVAHDFNNILTVLQGYVQLMQNRSAADHPFARYLARMMESTERAAKLVQNLMVFSRKQALSANTCDINAVLRNFKEFLSRLIPEDIVFRLELAPGPLQVKVDVNQLEQALTNLVANARDAMPKGGRLTISVRANRLDEGFIRQHGFGKTGPYVQIYVTDTGCGMDKATCQKIFEPFFTTKAVGKGTGLGLAIVYGIIKQNSGFVTVASTPGQGTTFRIDLPLTAETQPAAALPTAFDPLLYGDETILVAEDQADLREMLVLTLHGYGYQVIAAGDGQEAVEQYRQHQGRVDLIVMDVVMPVKNGKDAADEIRCLNPAASILFASGYTMDIIQSRGELGADEELLLKPIKPPELLRHIRQTLDSNRPRP